MAYEVISGTLLVCLQLSKKQSGGSHQKGLHGDEPLGNRIGG